MFAICLCWYIHWNKTLCNFSLVISLPTTLLMEANMPVFDAPFNSILGFVGNFFDATFCSFLFFQALLLTMVAKGTACRHIKQSYKVIKFSLRVCECYSFNSFMHCGCRCSRRQIQCRLFCVWIIPCFLWFIFEIANIVIANWNDACNFIP